uniref:Kinetochore protein SPC25 n=1 Tax=Brassica campestris TaxID=3711 RepID=M4DNI7_BRACM
MEQLNYIRGGDTTKKTMVSLGPGPAYKGGQAVRPPRVRVRVLLWPLTVLSRPCLGLMREKDIAEHRLKIDSCVASPFQRSVDSVLDRAKATAQSQYFAVSKDSAGNVTQDNIKDAISWYKQALGFNVEAGHGVKFTFTNIDAKRPTREFSFTVHYGNDIYSYEG